MATVPETITLGVRLPWWRGLYLRWLMLWVRLHVLARREVTVDPEAFGERIANAMRFYVIDKRGRKRRVKP
jgi:hypothetical protein